MTPRLSQDRNRSTGKICLKYDVNVIEESKRRHSKTVYQVALPTLVNNVNVIARLKRRYSEVVLQVTSPIAGCDTKNIATNGSLLDRLALIKVQNPISVVNL